MNTRHTARIHAHRDGGLCDRSAVELVVRGATRDGTGTSVSGTQAVAFRRTRIHPGIWIIAFVRAAPSDRSVPHADAERAALQASVTRHHRKETIDTPIVQTRTHVTIMKRRPLVGPLSTAAVGPVSRAEQTSRRIGIWQPLFRVCQMCLPQHSSRSIQTFELHSARGSAVDGSRAEVNSPMFLGALPSRDGYASCY